MAYLRLYLRAYLGFCRRQKQGRLAGVAGFEPTNTGSKDRCLTTWRHPKNYGGVGAGKLYTRPASPGAGGKYRNLKSP